MTFEIVNLILLSMGLAFSVLLFYRFPKLPTAKNDDEFPTVSIIIPARNEETNLQLLLKDLQAQSMKPHQIICVNDDSTDTTAKVAQSFGATLINLADKPESWTGKTWACQNGADMATGSLLLFLDADVRLGRDGLARLVQAYQDNNCTISVQPFHLTEKPYEQLSLVFNLVQIAGNGTTLPWKTNIGVHGPVLLISRTDYAKIGGHESVRQCVVEDMAFGQKLKEKQLQYQLFMGDEDVSYRMYPGGLRSLVQGWVKNFAVGAAKTPAAVFFMSFFWIGSMANVPFYLADALLNDKLPMIIGYGVLYPLWVIVLSVLSRKIGRFHIIPIIFFPVLIIGFMLIFFISLVSKLLGLPVRWKGRVIVGEDKA
jgi:4,4'-diaponeurosporenoate glycosyltransferase